MTYWSQNHLNRLQTTGQMAAGEKAGDGQTPDAVAEEEILDAGDAGRKQFHEAQMNWCDADGGHELSFCCLQALSTL